MAYEEAPTSRRVLTDRRTISVLLVDDQRFVGVALERLLAGERDIEVHCCFDAVAAIEHANQVGPTLILQDLVLPDIDGLTLVKMFRANPPTADTPIIVLSGNDDAETRRRAIAGGASDYLVKLPSRHDLIACIRRHAAAARAGDGNLGTAASTGPTTASRGGPHETLDRCVIDEFRQMTTDGAPEFMLTLIEQFIQLGAAQLDMLRDAGHRRDVRALKATAHALKGSSLTMGARHLAALCSQLEDHTDDFPDGAAHAVLMLQLDEEFAKVQNVLEAERKRCLT